MSKSVRDKDHPDRKAIFMALKEMNVREVTVEYNGSGDSGMFEDAELKSKDGVQLLAESLVIERDKKSSKFVDGEWVEAIKKVKTSIVGYIDDFCYDLMSDIHAGWEINEGSSGTLIFNVDKESIKIEHNQYYIESNFSEMEI